MHYTTLISPADVARHLGDARWVVCDCRHDLGDVQLGRREYREAHIPGARFLHLDDDLSGPRNGRNGRHPLPDPQALAIRLGECGIGNDTQVVAYDASGGCYAARLWWLLRWLGHAHVAVIDGGWQAWVRSGHATTAEVRPARPAQFVPRLQAQLAVDAAFVLRHLDTTEACVVDARSPDRFRGENETLDPVGGHIPGATNRFFRDNLDASGQFKPADRLRQELQQVLGARAPAQVIHQCGSGVTACHNLLAMEHAGLAGSRLYPGSWSEWISDPARPVAR
ncbi:MAG TPA: sulfurtransferase [Burkholderiales bacterium]|nr:sulfurtransferase [Burkholderiales bacterium]